MLTPFERLEKIIAAQSPSEVVFKAIQLNKSSIELRATKTKEAENKIVHEDAELQLALKHDREHWDAEQGKYSISANVEQLWAEIKRTILYEYDSVSTRCDATKRKTEKFIKNVGINDKHLPNYLIQVFLKLRSEAQKEASRLERADLMEQFEALRRTYGKRA